jgi:hypothetical protein
MHIFIPIVIHWFIFYYFLFDYLKTLSFSTRPYRPLHYTVSPLRFICRCFAETGIICFLECMQSNLMRIIKFMVVVLRKMNSIMVEVALKFRQTRPNFGAGTAGTLEKLHTSIDNTI